MSLEKNVADIAELAYNHAVFEVMRAALVEARAVILTVVSNAMILEPEYDPSRHPVIKQIDAALARSQQAGGFPRL
jgi:hypothetical protein